MPQQFIEGAYPFALKSAKGCLVTDVDGHEYVDFIMALGAVGIGYESARAHSAWSLPSAVEAEYAEQLCAAILCGLGGMVRFVSTGSEATEGAMRIARAVTGRPTILSVGYHGWHTMHDAVLREKAWGVPRATWPLVVGVPWGDFAALSAALRQHRVAGVLLEPMLHQRQPLGYFGAIRAKTRHAKVVLIFDEVVTGFRWAIGGAQEFFGVVPDLACFGKAMSNGWPLAAIIGRRDLMEEAGKLVSGTFNGWPSALEAGRRTLTRYRDRDIIRRLWAAGRAFQTTFDQRAAAHGVPVRVKGYFCKPYLATTETGLKRPWVALVVQEAARHGVLLHPTSLNVSAAHTPRIMTQVAEALDRALRAVGHGATLRGSAPRPAFQRVRS